MGTVNKERVALLVQALRSGDYQQTKGALCRVNDNNGDKTYCCLGVACEVAIANGLYIRLETSDDSKGTLIMFNGGGGSLPETVRDWYGFVRSNPPISATAAGVPAMCQCASCRDGQPRDQEIAWAISANDTHNATFEQIADGFEALYLTEDTEVAA